MMGTKDLSYYLGLKYPVTATERPDGAYFVGHPDLDGCVAEGDDLQEAIANLADARELWIETRLENGYSVPEPKASSDPEYSGRISLRMAPSLHEKLAVDADRKGISLNLLVNTVLALYAGGEDPLFEMRKDLKAAIDQITTASTSSVRTGATVPHAALLPQPTSSRDNVLPYRKKLLEA